MDLVVMVVRGWRGRLRGRSRMKESSEVSQSPPRAVLLLLLLMMMMMMIMMIMKCSVYNHMVGHPRCVFIKYIWLNHLSNTTNLWWIDVNCIVINYMFRRLWPSSVLLLIRLAEIKKGKQSWVIKGHKTMIMVFCSLINIRIYSTVLPSFRVNPKDEGCKFLQTVG